MSEKLEKLIDQALKEEPTFKLRNDFKDRVVKIIKRKERIAQRHMYVWIALGSLVILGFGYGILLYFLPHVLEHLTTAHSGVGSIIPFGIVGGILISIVQFLDKKLVKDKMLRL